MGNFIKIFFVSILVLLLNILNSYAAQLSKDYLWLEIDDVIEGQGNLPTQQVNICFGQFPYAKKTITELDELKVYYTLGQRNKLGKEIFYDLNIKEAKGHSSVEISLFSPNWLKIIAIGKRLNGSGLRYNYLCESSFFPLIKNNGVFNKNNILMSPISDIPDNRFNISIYRERIGEFFTRNRLSGFPIRFEIKFGNKPFKNEVVNLLEENGNTYSMNTDAFGEFVYIPQDEINTNKAIKNDQRISLVYAEQRLGDVIYNATYCTLLRKKYFQRSVNLSLGLILFFLSLVLYCWLLTKRRCI